MHSRVFAVSKNGEIRTDELSEDDVFGMLGRDADLVRYEKKDFSEDLKWLFGVNGIEEIKDYSNRRFRINADVYFKSKYKAFKTALHGINEAVSHEDAYRDFKKSMGSTLGLLLYDLRMAYNESLGFYVYNIDTQILQTLDSFCRANPSYEGYVVKTYDYHF